MILNLDVRSFDDLSLGYVFDLAYNFPSQRIFPTSSDLALVQFRLYTSLNERNIDPYCTDRAVKAGVPGKAARQAGWLRD